MGGDPEEWSPPALYELPSDESTGSAVRTLNSYVRNLKELPSPVNAVVAVDLEQAFSDAKHLDDLSNGGHVCGPLHGMPILVKDNIDVMGLPTTNGSASHDGRPAVADAVAVARLRQAGAVVYGKTNMDELALGATSSNSRFPKAVNAWDPNRLPGGSSGGSAVAVAVGAAYGALGTDTAGSVRTPAAFNGVVALRPTFGALPTDGVRPLSSMFDTVGPIAGNVNAVLQLFLAMLGPVRLPSDARLNRYPCDGGAGPLDGLRIGVPGRFFFDGACPEVAASVTAATEVLCCLGATLVDIELPGVESTQAQMSTIMLRDGYLTYRDSIERTPSLIHPVVLQRVGLGRGVSASSYDAAVNDKSTWTNTVKACFDSIDILAVPTTPVVAPRKDHDRNDLEAVHNVTQFTFAWSFAGVPALSIPCGMYSGMPVGMQLVGPHGSDIALARVASLYEHETLWNQAFEQARRDQRSNS
jgi:aspartyl-tRNA(Asn)/glutamyl-tRNA(Gln) amidotransferase subunit A